MASRAMNNFNKLKAQGLSDDEAMKQAFGLVAKGRKAVRVVDTKKAEVKKLKRRSTSKVRMAVTGKLKRASHSPAGQRHLRRKKAGL